MSENKTASTSFNAIMKYFNIRSSKDNRVVEKEDEFIKKSPVSLSVVAKLGAEVLALKQEVAMTKAEQLAYQKEFNNMFEDIKQELRSVSKKLTELELRHEELVFNTSPVKDAPEDFVYVEDVVDEEDEPVKGVDPVIEVTYKPKKKVMDNNTVKPKRKVLFRYINKLLKLRVKVKQIRDMVNDRFGTNYTVQQIYTKIYTTKKRYSK